MVGRNLSGNKFGRLKIISFIEIRKGRSFYECLCDCGNKVSVNGKYLSNGDTKSCGCLKRDTALTNSKACITHGLTKHPLYGVWSSLKDRCLNEKCHAYAHYGRRGIGVSAEWMDFNTFYQDVIGTYAPGLELDRRNNDGNYCKENFRWVTPKINKRNRRNTVFLTVDGVTKPLGEWVELTGLSRHSIWGRIKSGLTGYEALYGSRYIKKHGKEKVY